MYEKHCIVCRVSVNEDEVLHHISPRATKMNHLVLRLCVPPQPARTHVLEFFQSYPV